MKGSRDARMLKRTARTYPGEGVEGCEDVGEDGQQHHLILEPTPQLGQVDELGLQTHNIMLGK